LFIVCVLAGCGAKASPPPSNAAAPAAADPVAEPTPAPTTPTATTCPEGQRYDECAHGSCDACDDCVAECVPL